MSATAISAPRRVLVVGLGSHGGGVGACRYFARAGSQVRVTDLKAADALGASLDALAGLGVETRLGGHDPADLDWADLVVASPAVPDESPYLAAARERGLPVEREMTLFCKALRARSIGITGSVGKTTTTTLLGAMLRGGPGTTLVGGNIGRSLLGDVEGLGPSDRVILELSSFQLQDLDRIGWSPDIAVWTNLIPNHLDRHRDMDDYGLAKGTILRHQGPSGVAVLPADDPLVPRYAVPRGRVLRFALDPGDEVDAYVERGVLVARWADLRLEVVGAGELRVPGEHNLRNAAAAVLAALAAGASLDAIRTALRAFEGVRGRVETVAEIAGVRYICDTAATTPHAAAAGIRAVRPGCVAICGGSSKRTPFEPLAHALAERASLAILIGETAPEIAAALGAAGSHVPVERAATIEEAVLRAARAAAPGCDVILAPACASFDMFRSAEHRGEVFRAAVRALAGPSRG